MIDFIKRLFGIKIVNIPTTTPPPTPPGTTGRTATHGQKVEQVAFDHAIALINIRLDNSNWIMTAVIILLVICFITLWFGYWQFASGSYNAYRDQVKQLNDDRYNLLKDRLDFVEKLATQSAK